MKGPLFAETMNEAYALRRKNVCVLTGDIHGLFWNDVAADFVPLERLLELRLRENFTLLRLDIATGLRFFDTDAEAEANRLLAECDTLTLGKEKIRPVADVAAENRGFPLSTLVLIKSIFDAGGKVRRASKEQKTKSPKPLCLIVQFAGKLFPEGDASRLSEIDRQRLIFFLSWMTDPLFEEGPDLVVFVNPIKSEVNGSIVALPNATHVEIQLPDMEDRKGFAELFMRPPRRITFEGGLERFAESTAGLTLPRVKDLLEIGSATKKEIKRADVVKEVNEILQARLGDIIRVKYPAHTPSDIIGYEETGKIFTEVFERCESPETAVAAMLISGSNGSGKTFQLEAQATQSGRVVIELANIRGSYFGETDKFFEQFRWFVGTFGKILVLVDEAHTAFGSVHSSNTHETEKRLSGNILKMMGDERYLGKILWGLMTSRPDELDPDVKSRASIQIPIFDLEGEERSVFVREIFARKQIKLSDEELRTVLAETPYYSARDYRNLQREVSAQRRKDKDVSPVNVLQRWQASKSIVGQRKFQELLAALHCSYPQLIPERLRKLDEEMMMRMVEEMKHQLLFR